jgi:hypothetical protein
MFRRSFPLTVESSSGIACGLAGKKNRKQSEEGKGALHMDALWLNESKDFTPYFFYHRGAENTEKAQRY